MAVVIEFLFRQVVKLLHFPTINLLNDFRNASLSLTSNYEYVRFSTKFDLEVVYISAYGAMAPYAEIYTTS